MIASRRKYINEIRVFIFYSLFIWPLHRLFVRKFITPRCKRCIASANLRPVDPEGLCQDCREDKRVQKASIDPKVRTELDQYLKGFSGQGQGDYDAVVLFSGGKDSVYMVDRLKCDYPGLRLMLLTVDNSFMSPVALANIQDLVRRLGIPHQTANPSPAFYEKMYRHAFLHLNDKGCSGTVDQFDGDIFHDVARNVAAANRIPLVISGCSKTQVTRILGLDRFEFPRSFESQNRHEVAGIKLRDIFSEEEMREWWNGALCEVSRRPHLIFPFYAWDLEEQTIIQSVTDRGLLPSGSANPLLTNNLLVPLMAMVDMVQFGYSSFEPEFTQMVREGKAEKKLWKNIFELSEYAAKTGKFVSASVDLALERLKLSRQDLGLPL